MYILVNTRNKNRRTNLLHLRKSLHMQYGHYNTDYFCIFAIFIVLSYLYYIIREERIPVLRSFTKEDILYIGHFRKYSNCMLYFHILTYKQGTSEAHFVAK